MRIVCSCDKDGNITMDSNTKAFIDAVCDVRETFDKAAWIYSQRGGFGEQGTMLDKIRSRRVQN